MGVMLFSSSPLTPVVVGRAGPEVMRAGELSHPLTGCRCWESGPYNLTGQHSGVGFRGMGVSEPGQSGVRQKCLPCLLLKSALGSLA